jgi:hypothetical protein
MIEENQGVSKIDSRKIGVGGARRTLARLARLSRNQRATIAPTDLFHGNKWERGREENRRNKPTASIASSGPERCAKDLERPSLRELYLTAILI